MTPLRTRVVRAVVLALVVFAVTANVAAADDSVPIPVVVPFDPGLPEQLPPLPPPPAPPE